MSILRKLKNLLKRFLPIPANSFYAALDELKQFFQSIRTGIAAENRKQINDASTQVSAMIMENRRQINNIVTDINWEIRKLVISNKQTVDEYKEEVSRQTDLSILRIDEIGKTLNQDVGQKLNESRDAFSEDVGQQLGEFGKVLQGDVRQELKNYSLQQKDQYLDLSLMQKEIITQIGTILEIQRQQQAMIEELMKMAEKAEH